MAVAPNDVSCKNNTYTEGVSMHYFPKNEAVRQKWIRCVLRHKTHLFSVRFTLRTAALNTGPSLYLKKMENLSS